MKYSIGRLRRKLKLDELIEEQLARFARTHGPDEIEKFSPQVHEGLVQVLLQQESPNNRTPHSAFSTFLTTLLDNGLTAEVEPAVAVYTDVYPNSVDYVLKSIPAKVINYLCRYTNREDVLKWTNDNEKWQEAITVSLKKGNFTSFLRQTRESIAAANTNNPFVKMLENFFSYDRGLSPQITKLAEQVLANAPKTVCLSPRESSEECNKLRYLILRFMMVDLEKRYGSMDNSKRIDCLPFYRRQREELGVINSQIVSFDPNPNVPPEEQYDYGVCIGWRYDSWEQFFYQASHEAVHLLNPVMSPGGSPKVSALDEGMAVRYAEEMRDKYLPYTTRAFVDSPIDWNNPYQTAWQATCKIPETVLRQIRQEFGSFGNINDPDRFASITSIWLKKKEANLLSEHFRYPRN